MPVIPLKDIETAAERYGWLNRIVAARIGRRTAAGVDYAIFEIV